MAKINFDESLELCKLGNEYIYTVCKDDDIVWTTKKSLTAMADPDAFTNVQLQEIFHTSEWVCTSSPWRDITKLPPQPVNLNKNSASTTVRHLEHWDFSPRTDLSMIDYEWHCEEAQSAHCTALELDGDFVALHPVQQIFYKKYGPIIYSLDYTYRRIKTPEGEVYDIFSFFKDIDYYNNTYTSTMDVEWQIQTSYKITIQYQHGSKDTACIMNLTYKQPKVLQIEDKAQYFLFTASKMNKSNFSYLDSEFGMVDTWDFVKDSSGEYFTCIIKVNDQEAVVTPSMTITQIYTTDEWYVSAQTNSFTFNLNQQQTLMYDIAGRLSA